jgi:hypothetical protein
VSVSKPPRRETSTSRRAQALALRAHGATFERIAASLKTTTKEARRLVAEALRPSRQFIAEHADEIRATEFTRLEQIYQAFAMHAIAEKDARAADVAMRAAARMTKLAGAEPESRVQIDSRSVSVAVGLSPDHVRAVERELFGLALDEPSPAVVDAQLVEPAEGTEADADGDADGDADE